jgi:D-alanine-D-alanine ligase
MPGMTAESQVPRVFAAAGLPYEQLVARLVDAATVPGSRMSAIHPAA